MMATFHETWIYIFQGHLFSSLIVHSFSAVVALLMLKRHASAMVVSALIFVVGVVIPITSGAITGALVARVLTAAGYNVPWYYAFLCGIGQTVFYVIMSFPRILTRL